MAAQTFTEAVQLQTTLMLRIAQRLDEKGYAVQVHNLNPDGSAERYMFGYISGGLGKFLREWADAASEGVSRATRKRAVLVHIYPDRNTTHAVRETGRVFDYPFKFACAIPSRVRYKAIHASLSLMSAERKGRWGSVKGQGIFEATKMSDNIEYRGNTKDALEVLLRVLEMPQHRAILLGR